LDKWWEVVRWVLLSIIWISQRFQVRLARPTPGLEKHFQSHVIACRAQRGGSYINDLLSSDDVDRMLEALVKLGVRVEGAFAGVRVHGMALFRSRMPICF
jgi:hypothetical protein